VAVTVTAAGLGTVAGAVYVTAAPEALLVGATDPPPADTVHVTPLAAVSFATVAVSAVVAPVCTEAVAGDTVTEIAGGGVVTVIVADPALVPSATEVAVTVAVAGLGTVAGAVYVTAAPEAALVGATDPPPAGTVHVTPLAVASFATVAVSCVVAPVGTEAVAGDTVTEIAGGGVELEPPPPHPLAIPTANTANANSRRAARVTCTPIKAVSRTSIINFYWRKKASAGLEVLSIQQPAQVAASPDVT
jgi:uncharacterized membrane protein YebE (DUF533 family)